MELVLSGPGQVTSALQGEGSDHRIRCDYTLDARVTGGRSTDEVVLLDLTLGWRGLSGQIISGVGDREFSSTGLDADRFFTNRIGSGETRTATRFIWLNPHRSFRGVHTLRYRTATGEEKVATYTLTCS